MGQKKTPLPLRERDFGAPAFESRDHSTRYHEPDTPRRSTGELLAVQGEHSAALLGRQYLEDLSVLGDSPAPKKLKALLLANRAFFKPAVEFSHLGKALLPDLFDLALQLLGQSKLCLNTWRVDHRCAQNIALNFR